MAGLLGASEGGIFTLLHFSCGLCRFLVDSALARMDTLSIDGQLRPWTPARRGREQDIMVSISYNHTGPAIADTMDEARRAVRTQAIKVRESVDAQHDVVFIAADGDVYAYLDQDAADADASGVSAFAVLTRVI